MMQGSLQPIRAFLRELASQLRGYWAADAAREAAKTVGSAQDVALATVGDFYPPSPQGRALKQRYTWPDGTTGHKFPTPKAQAYFFGVILKRGLVPYQRRFNLQKAVTAEIYEVRPDGYTMRYSIDTNKAPYAERVMGERQYYYHAETGWPQLVALPSRVLDNQRAVDYLAKPLYGVLAGYVAQQGRGG